MIDQILIPLQNEIFKLREKNIFSSNFINFYTCFIEKMHFLYIHVISQWCIVKHVSVLGGVIFCI